MKRFQVGNCYPISCVTGSVLPDDKVSPDMLTLLDKASTSGSIYAPLGSLELTRLGRRLRWIWTLLDGP